MDAECIKYLSRIKGAVFKVSPHFSCGKAPFLARDLKVEEREGRSVFVCITQDGEREILRADVNQIDPLSAEDIFREINHERRMRQQLQERMRKINGLSC